MRAQPKKKVEPFAQVPLEWAIDAAAALRCPRLLLVVQLCHLAWKANGKAFPVSTRELERMGVSRFVKREGLYDLETRGLIVVTRQRGRAPTVRMVGNWWR